MPRDRRSYKDRSSGQGKENTAMSDANRTLTDKATSRDDDRHRLRDRKRVMI